jgi:hypothetical protein
VTRRSRCRWVLASAVLTIAVARPPAVTAQTATSPFEACAPAGRPWAYDDLLCVYQAGARERRLAEARDRLRALGAGDGGHPWATLVLGHATLNDDEVGAIGHYQTAAGGFVQSREAEGEVIARQNLRFLLRRRGELAAAARQVELAVASAAASRQPLTIARASVLEAAHLVETGGDIGRAQRLLARAERLAFPGGSIGLQRSILFQLASANLYLGLFDEAIDALDRHRALRQVDGSTADAAAVAFNLLNAHVARNEARPVAGARIRLVAMAQAVVAETQALERPYVEAQAHRLLGDLLRPVDPIQAAQHLRRCLDIERPLGYPAIRAACLWSLSRLEVARDRARAERLSQEAIALVSADPAGPLLAFAWQARLRLVWDTLAESGAVAESLAALEAVERLRAAQPDEGSRAALFGSWTQDYYWLAGRLLVLDPPRLDQAFAVGERLRARVLLDRLTRAGIPSKGATPQTSLADLSRRIAETQRSMLSVAMPERRVLSDRLALMDLERRALGGSDVPAADPSTLPFASLDTVRAALAPDEAMLWYSLAPWTDLYGEFGGGAWLLAITRDAVKVHRLETRVDLDSQVAAFAGLLRQREVAAQVWKPAALQLGRVLLGGALASMPPTVRRLVVVSDGALHGLPFEALMPAADGVLIAERFEIAVLPSATLWLRLRSIGSPSPSAAVVMADPELPRSPDDNLQLAPLPGARREARAVAAALGLDASRVIEGAAASERALKSLLAGDTSVLHLATHARADAGFPDRSAVFLSPGADGEDGWLQPPEIAALQLGRALVVLSACESAGGQRVAGEGVLSLARAFFAGGAGTVIATRWPLRDDDAAFVMERFYAALGSGASVGGAMQRARLDSLAAGLPVAAWAGFALLGDASGAPVHTATPAAPRRWWLIVAVGLVVISAWWVRRVATGS